MRFVMMLQIQMRLLHFRSLDDNLNFWLNTNRINLHLNDFSGNSIHTLFFGCTYVINQPLSAYLMFDLKWRWNELWTCISTPSLWFHLPLHQDGVPARTIHHSSPRAKTQFSSRNFKLKNALTWKWSVMNAPWNMLFICTNILENDQLKQCITRNHKMWQYFSFLCVYV